jgi:hypothetical protein
MAQVREGATVGSNNSIGGVWKNYRSTVNEVTFTLSQLSMKTIRAGVSRRSESDATRLSDLRNRRAPTLCRFFVCTTEVFTHDHRRARGDEGGSKKNSGIENVNSAFLTLSIV